MKNNNLIRWATHIGLLTSLMMTPIIQAGTYCGSTGGGDLSRLYAKTSSDWWPDVLANLIVGVVSPTGLFSSAFCATTQGQAYFGEGCQIHDACYEGKYGLGMTREECDSELRAKWKQACTNKYKPANSLDIGQKFCQDYCKNTADAMYLALTAGSKDVWDQAREQRDANIEAAIHQVYLEIYGRSAYTDEIALSKNYLATTKSLDALKTKVRQEYVAYVTAGAAAARLVPVTQLILD